MLKDIAKAGKYTCSRIELKQVNTMLKDIAKAGKVERPSRFQIRF